MAQCAPQGPPPQPPVHGHVCAPLQGSYIIQVDVDTEKGGLSINPNFCEYVS